MEGLRARGSGNMRRPGPDIAHFDCLVKIPMAGGEVELGEND